MFRIKAHTFFDGAQHRLLEKQRPSSYDTAIICLQNEANILYEQRQENDKTNKQYKLSDICHVYDTAVICLQNEASSETKQRVMRRTQCGMEYASYRRSEQYNKQTRNETKLNQRNTTNANVTVYPISVICMIHGARGRLSTFNLLKITTGGGSSCAAPMCINIYIYIYI